ncbi:MAG: excinuclease ABC subunit UvrA [Rhodobacteraceae bacterium]|nr:excinuclease ABC subunit UvrA [Paracoccaceae bacterium]
MAELTHIRVRGAREHNLKSIDVDIPRNKFVVVTGVSGSGKSSLALDTVFAEGQRRYAESLSAYARQFLSSMEKPDVDLIEGLSPAIAIEQKTTSSNPRSTVATITEIHDYLRLLFARAGTPHSPATGLPIKAQQVSDMVDRIMQLDSGTRFHLLAPVIRDRKGAFSAEMKEFRKKGFLRVRIDGKTRMLSDRFKIYPKKRHNIDLVVDRQIVQSGIEGRLAESLRTTLDAADGLAVVELIDRNPVETILLSENHACPVSGFTVPKMEPRMFSFNTHVGACPSCDGLGYEIRFVEQSVILYPDSPMAEAWSPNVTWCEPKVPAYYDKYARLQGIDPRMPWNDLPSWFRTTVLHGTESNGEQVRVPNPRIRLKPILPLMEKIYEKANKSVRRLLGPWRQERDCKDCNGYRLKQESLSVQIAGLHIGQVLNKSIRDALIWIHDVPSALSVQERTIAKEVLKEISGRLQFLANVGLDYLTLARAASTLSGGESQRIRLASQIGAGLTGVLYVLDEPSIGLHQRDNRRLLDSLENLRDRGNTVVVVEHDEEAIRSADHLIDLGPGAGIHGGEVVAAGTPEEVAQSRDSLTAKYLRGEESIPIPPKRRNGHGLSIGVRAATLNNLKRLNVDIPLGKLVCVTGVSGSGKSSLINGTLCSQLQSFKSGRLSAGGGGSNIYIQSGADLYCDRVVEVSQRPIGKTPRSNPATYTKIFDPIRNWFAQLPESNARGYTKSRFSFNVKGGRCEHCKGEGVIKVSMLFLPDVFVPCESCNGSRFNRETLEVKFRGKSIADVLHMTVEEASVHFASIPLIHSKLELMLQVGLGYIRLGQPSPLLSGGEAQRIKLARELGRTGFYRTLYFLDEPTTGLHFDDIRKLLKVLHSLVDRNHTVIVIEHNLDVIKSADWIIDLGPEGGAQGGRLVCQGTPESVARCPDGHTGKFLRDALRNQELRTS